jgi:anti-sigma factor RsiW
MNNPEQKPLREALRAQFQDERLDSAQLDALRARMSATAPAESRRGGASADGPAQPGRRRLFAVAASVAATATVGYWGLFGLRAFRDASNIDVLADEIAYNHLYDKPLDVSSGSLDALREAFAGVGFMLQDVPFELPVGAELIGGRHCSIASVPAVMLRYRVGNGVVGVCQARFDPARHRGVPDMQVASAPATAMSRGIKISLCHDRGVLMAMATA